MALENDFTLTLDEAMRFLTKTLEIDRPSAKMKQSRLGFLNEFILQMTHFIPFQSVVRISIPPERRRRPTFEEMKEDMMTRRGGTCAVINNFTKVLLVTLGYEAYHYPADFFGKPDNHMGIMVRNVTGEKSLHLVEVACGYPVFEAIPVDFEKESKVYVHCFLDSKFVKDEDGRLRWMVKDRASMGPNKTDEESWFQLALLHINKAVRSSYFHSFQDKNFISPSYEFQKRIRCVMFPNGQLVAMKGNKIMWTEPGDKVVRKREVERREEIEEFFKTNFPQFSEELLQASLDNNKYLEPVEKEV